MLAIKSVLCQCEILPLATLSCWNVQNFIETSHIVYMFGSSCCIYVWKLKFAKGFTVCSIMAKLCANLKACCLHHLILYFTSHAIWCMFNCIFPDNEQLNFHSFLLIFLVESCIWQYFCFSCYLKGKADDAFIPSTGIMKEKIDFSLYPLDRS
jgi:hypothetical protein